MKASDLIIKVVILTRVYWKILVLIQQPNIGLWDNLRALYHAPVPESRAVVTQLVVSRWLTSREAAAKAWGDGRSRLR